MLNVITFIMIINFEIKLTYVLFFKINGISSHFATSVKVFSGQNTAIKGISTGSKFYFISLKY